MGLNASDKDSVSKNNDSNNENDKYSGPKEIIFVSGWANINSIYWRYFWGFLARIFLGVVIILTFSLGGKNLIYLASALLFLSFCHVIYNGVQIIRYDKSNINFRVMYWVDMALAFGYFIYFLGFLLALT